MFGQNKQDNTNNQEVCHMENNKQQKREQNRSNQSNKAGKKKAAVKSEKLRYKNADSIYDF